MEGGDNNIPFAFLKKRGIINRKEKVCITCLRQVFLLLTSMKKWGSEMFDERNVIISVII